MAVDVAFDARGGSRFAGDDNISAMRKIVCERFDFLVAQRIGDVGHHGLAAGTHA